MPTLITGKLIFANKFCCCRFRLSEGVIRKYWTNWWVKFREKLKAELTRSKSEPYYRKWSHELPSMPILRVNAVFWTSSLMEQWNLHLIASTVVPEMCLYCKIYSFNVLITKVFHATLLCVVLLLKISVFNSSQLS